MAVRRKVFGSRVIVALDFPGAGDALEFVARLEPQSCRLKVGKELFVAAGPELVRSLATMGFDVFLDLKFHDIPNTVARACKAAAALGCWMINVHALGGETMMRAARAALDDFEDPPLLAAVTILTSQDDGDLRQIGIEGGAKAAALRLAKLAGQCGMDGVVCSAAECAEIKGVAPDGFLCVTPGIRPGAFAGDDQKRGATPQSAVGMGSDFLVMGRPITQAPDPVQALREANEAVALALGVRRADFEGD